ncbi:MAG: hypothetical protein QXG58_00015 [Candidatus Bathyarchaeia archaeon]
MDVSVGGHNTDTKMAEVLEILADGKWHMKKEILEKTGLKPKQLETIIGFLVDYGFIMVDDEGGSVRLNENFRKLLLQEVNQ